MNRPYRENECIQGHKWMAPVRLSKVTHKLCGEEHEYCPTCGMMAQFSSEWINEDGTPFDMKAVGFSFYGKI